MNRKQRKKNRLRTLLKYLENDFVIIGILVLGGFILGAFGVTISWLIAIVIVILFVAFVLLLRIIVIPQLLEPETGSQGMIGLEGEVVQPLNPIGLIRVSGEHWKARSASGTIASGKKVEVIGIENLTLKVRLQE